MARTPTSQIARGQVWNLEATLRPDGSVESASVEDILLAHQVEAFRTSREILSSLRTITGLLRSLGRDGLHLVISDAAKAVRAKKKREAAKRKAARDAAKAVKP